MAGLHHKVRLYLEANGKTEAELFDVDKITLRREDGVSFISLWNVSGLAEPTDAQLNALESQADIVESNNEVIRTRKGLYGSTAEQLEYIVENGVDSFITKQNQIKSDNPKG